MKSYLLYTSLLTIFFSTQVLVAQTKVIAHRGYWDCEGSAQNSIFALKKAQKVKIYGSEFDVIITADTIPVINHDPKISGFLIEETPFRELKKIRIKNGERLPTLKSYLKQGKKDKESKLILEIKPHGSKEKEDKAVSAIVRMVKKMSLESQIEYISFSLNICKELIRLDTMAKVAYLDGKLSPEEAVSLNFTGIDYHFNVFRKNKDWISQAKKLGLTVNVWTVNDENVMREMIDQGVDFITTDKPVEAKLLVEKQVMPIK